MNFLKELFGIHTEEFHPQTLVGIAFKETVKIVSASSTCFYKKKPGIACTSGKRLFYCNRIKFFFLYRLLVVKKSIQ